MRHTCIHLKSWWFQNIQSFWRMLAKKGPPLRQPSPRRALRIFKQHSWFTAFHHVLFEYCQNFHYDMTGFAMQMQVRCFLRRSAHRFFVFVSHPWEKWLLDKDTTAGISRVPDVFMYSKCPSGGHKGPANDYLTHFSKHIRILKILNFHSSLTHDYLYYAAMYICEPVIAFIYK